MTARSGREGAELEREREARRLVAEAAKPLTDSERAREVIDEEVRTP